MLWCRSCPRKCDVITNTRYVLVRHWLLGGNDVIIAGAASLSAKRISARLGDILSDLYQLTAVLHYAKLNRWKQSMMPLVHWSCQWLLYKIEGHFDQCLRQMPHRFIAMTIRFVIFPLGRHCQKPSDVMDQTLAQAVGLDSNVRQWLAQHIDLGKSALVDIDKAWQQVMLSKAVQAKLDPGYQRRLDSRR